MRATRILVTIALLLLAFLVNHRICLIGGPQPLLLSFRRLTGDAQWEIERRKERVKRLRNCSKSGSSTAFRAIISDHQHFAWRICVSLAGSCFLYAIMMEAGAAEHGEASRRDSLMYYPAIPWTYSHLLDHFKGNYLR